MALTVTTDLTDISTAESVTNWGFFGSGADSTAIEPDFFAQGSNCISVNASGVTVEGLVYDNTTGLNFSTTHAGKLVYIWVRASAFSLLETRANGGLRIILGSGTTRPQAAAGAWSAWYVDGSDTFAGTDGFKCYVIDPRKTPSLTQGTLDLTAIRWFGAAERQTGTLKGQNFGVDAVRYGFGELRARGANTTTGAGFKEMSNADFGTTANRYGIMIEKEGIFYVTGRLVIGDSVSTNSTDFTSENETLVWTTPTYYDSTREAFCMNDARDDGTPYFGVTLVGNGTGNTNVQFGQKVGSGDSTKGRSGPLFIGSRIPTGFDGDDGAVENVYIYGTTFNKFRAGIDLGSNATSDEFDGNNVIGCGSLQAGPVELRNCIFVDNLGGAYKIFEDFINARATGAEALTVADPRCDWIVVLNGSNLSVPSASAGYVELLDPGASDRREVVQISGDVVGSDDHYTEAIIRWPVAGASQGALGITIRGTIATTENYWYLKADITNSLLSLIRCDGGTDTTVSSSAVTFLEDTDYLLHLYGSGTTIEGFSSGNSVTTKLSTTSSTYQTNRRVGIRGDAEADQTGDAPRLSRFGAGPITNILGAVRMPAAALQDVKYCSFINNARATSITDTATHSYTGHSFSGNMTSLRNQSGGSVTINVASGDSPSPVENEAAGSTTINNAVTLTIAVKNSAGTAIQNAQVAIYKISDDSQLMNEDTDASGIATESFNFLSNTDIYIRVRKSSTGDTKYIPASATGTITASGFSVTITLLVDPNA